MTENLIKAARMYPKSCLFVVLFFPVFFNCFGFPLWNFSRVLAGTMTISYTGVMTLIVLYYLAALACARFAPDRPVPVWLGLMGLSLLGLVCRLVMEWGEVSITTDFTLPNLLVHLLVMGLVFALGCQQARSQS